MCYSPVVKLGGLSVAQTSTVVPGQKELALQEGGGKKRVVVPGLSCLKGIVEVCIQLTILVEVRSPCILNPQNHCTFIIGTSVMYPENCCYCTALPPYPGGCQALTSLQVPSPVTWHSERPKF